MQNKYMQMVHFDAFCACYPAEALDIPGRTNATIFSLGHRRL